MSANALRPPGELSADWCNYWTRCKNVLEDQGSFDFPQKALLDEFVLALVEAQNMRAIDEKTAWDRAVKRAVSLADQLALTPRGRKAAGIGSGEEAQDDPFADFDGLKLAG